MANAQIDSLIELLAQVRQHVRMYLHPLDGTSALNFVHGTRAAALTLVAVGDVRDAWWEAQAAHGYAQRATGPLPQMEKRGLTDEQMADEILAIEIDMWRILRDRPDRK